MSEILSTIGKAACVAVIAATEAVSSTVSKACEVIPEIGKATCNAAQAASEVAGIVADVVSKKS